MLDSIFFICYNLGVIWFGQGGFLMEKKNCEFSFSCVYNYSGSLYYLDVLLKDGGLKRDGNEWNNYYEDELEEEPYSMDENIIISQVGNYAQIFVEIKAYGSFWEGSLFAAHVDRLEELIDSAENETIWRTANNCDPAMSNDEMWELFEVREIDDDI